MKRECGENPQRYQSLYASKNVCPSAKAGHWETEKALANRSLYCNTSRKTCFDVVPYVVFHRYNSSVTITEAYMGDVRLCFAVECDDTEINCCGNF